MHFAYKLTIAMFINLPMTLITSSCVMNAESYLTRTIYLHNQVIQSCVANNTAHKVKHNNQKYDREKLV